MVGKQEVIADFLVARIQTQSLRKWEDDTSGNAIVDPVPVKGRKGQNTLIQNLTIKARIMRSLASL